MQRLIWLMFVPAAVMQFSSFGIFEVGTFLIFLVRTFWFLVVTLVWSEFGRRPEENDSAGTDHGAGGAAFLMGTPAKGTMVGEWPGLDTLDEDDNMRSTSDFRALYCGLIEQWFGVDAGAVIPGAGNFPRATLIG